MLDCLCTRCF